MKRQGFSLVEVLIAIMLIGVLTVAFFPPLSQGISTMLQTRKFTEKTFESQQKIEHEIIELNNGVKSGWSNQKVSISLGTGGSTIDVPLMIKEFKGEEAHPILLALSEDRQFLPEVPEIESVDLIESTPNTFKGSVKYKNKKSDPKKNWEPDVEFCLYRWYLADLKYIDSDFNVKDTSKLILLKEYNPIREDGKGPKFEKERHMVIPTEEAEKEIEAEGKKYSVIAGGDTAPVITIIPNTKSASTTEKKSDEFWKNSLNVRKVDSSNFDTEEMSLIYANKGIVFSATPIAKKSGNLGRETYSKMISLGYENPSLSYALLLGIEPIPESVGDVHMVDAAVSLKSDYGNVSNQKFEVRVIDTTGGFEYFKNQIKTNEQGKFTFKFEVKTTNTYKIEVKGISSKDLYVEGEITFQRLELIFRDNEKNYPADKNVELNAEIIGPSGEPVNGATVVYEVYNVDNIMIRRALAKSNKHGYVKINTKCKDPGKYYVVAKLKTSKSTIESKYEFEILSQVH